MTPLEDWRDGGRWLPTDAGKVFVRSGPGDAPTVLLLHGFPSSSFDFRAVLPHLAGLRELRPKAPVVELPGLGHYPQIEDPDAFTDAVLRLLNPGT